MAVAESYRFRFITGDTHVHVPPLVDAAVIFRLTAPHTQVRRVGLCCIFCCAAASSGMEIVGGARWIPAPGLHMMSFEVIPIFKRRNITQNTPSHSRAMAA